MFDPFGDHETAGYLRNSQQEKDLDIVKAAEHALFRAQLPEALAYLARRDRIEYEDFLEVHRLLFSALYPWAGMDRAEVLPEKAVIKGSVYFCHPRDCRRAVEDGLTRAQERGQISTRPGLIMGLFAYGHPFLDGNGRTMLLVHAELCFRAGMSVDWTPRKRIPTCARLRWRLRRQTMATWTPTSHLSSVQPCQVTSGRRLSHACRDLTALARKRTQPQHMPIR